MGGVRCSVGIVVLLAAAALTGCAGSPDRDSVSRTAQQFVEAVQDKNGSAACELLTPDAQDAAVGATNAKCEDAVVNIDSEGTNVTSVQVWQDAAQARIGSDVLFLSHMHGGWRVRAAGCSYDTSHRGYQCDVQG
jgi:hypothetical protein